MKIVATADLHGTLPEDLPESDVLIIAGDVCPRLDHNTVFQRSWLETNFESWLTRQKEKAGCIIGIGGNHDFALERYRLFADSLSWEYLLDEWIELDGVKFWGTPWVPNLSRWAFHQMDHELDAKFQQIPPRTDVIIAHGPAFGYCDRTVPRFGDCHAGFPGWNNVLDEIKPSLFICGHIHEGYGHSPHFNGSTEVCNVAHMTENYEPINPPAEIYFTSAVDIMAIDQRPTAHWPVDHREASRGAQMKRDNESFAFPKYRAQVNLKSARSLA